MVQAGRDVKGRTVGPLSGWKCCLPPCVFVRADQALDVGSEHSIRNLRSSMHTPRRRRWESTQFGKGWTEEASLKWGLEACESGVWEEHSGPLK